MKVYAGTSGYSYKGWKGGFYPADLQAQDMLSFYAGKLPSVEINNTFYRMPRAHVLESWAGQVPGEFRFAIKASRRITHIRRLKDPGSEMEYLFGTLGTLGDRLGVVLFQLPPNLKKDLPRLERFLDLVPAGARIAFEFRNPSWHEDDVRRLLKSRDAAVCHADDSKAADQPLGEATWGYLRLRRDEYGEADLKGWAERIREAGWDTTFVFFKHEELGPQLAARFLAQF